MKLKTELPIAVAYPKYPENGWEVTAQPEGTLNDAKGEEYSYLFWELNDQPRDWRVKDGFCIKGAESAGKLRSYLKAVGLSPCEYNEFIVYWYPILKQHKWVQLHFAVDYQKAGKNLSNPAGEYYRELAGLEVSPEPQTTYRLIMLWAPVPEQIDLKAQTLPKLEHEGFTVVEWGGARMKTGRNAITSHVRD